MKQALANATRAAKARHHPPTTRATACRPTRQMNSEPVSGVELVDTEWRGRDCVCAIKMMQERGPGETGLSSPLYQMLVKMHCTATPTSMQAISSFASALGGGQPAKKARKCLDRSQRYRSAALRRATGGVRTELRLARACP